MTLDKDKSKHPGHSVTVHLPDHDDKSVRELDQSGLGSVLAAIMHDERTNKGLAEVVLKGGVVKAAALRGADVAWTRTIWRRSGPLVTEEPLINPVDVVLPMKR